MSFKGDNINGYEAKERKWDCQRLLEGYYHSSATLNYLRGLVSAGNLSAMSQVQVDFMKDEAATKVAKAISSQKPSAEFAEFFMKDEAATKVAKAISSQKPSAEF